jgi:hypothetical protein
VEFAPLLHSGFKWFNNQEGTAGYVMVSATNERDKKWIQKDGILKLNTSRRLFKESDILNISMKC